MNEAQHKWLNSKCDTADPEQYDRYIICRIVFLIKREENAAYFLYCYYNWFNLVTSAEEWIENLQMMSDSPTLLLPPVILLDTVSYNSRIKRHFAQVFAFRFYLVALMFCLLEMEKTCTRLSSSGPIQMENGIKYTNVTTNIKSSSISRIRRHGENQWTP